MGKGYIVSGMILVMCMTLCHKARGQSRISNEAVEEGPPTSGIPPEDSLENTVFAEMLRIVDQKFDSLSARMSVLERSINSLNFYSVRQFREIVQSIESSTDTTEHLRTQISKLDADDRALKAAVSQVGRDINGIKRNIGVINVGMNDVKSHTDAITATVKEFRGNSEKMLDDIATSVVYLNENTKQRMDELKGSIEDTMETKTNSVTNQMEVHRAALSRSISQLEASSRSSDSTNCSINFGPLGEQLDRKFAEMKHQTQNHFLQLLNAEYESGNDVKDSEPPTGLARESEPPSSRNNVEGRGERGESRETGQSGRAGEGRGERDGEKVMRMLANMTRNVMDAVTYFRHTGGMMERLLATTENVAREQNNRSPEKTRLRYDILETSGLPPPGSDAGLPEELAGRQQANESESLPEEDELGPNSIKEDADLAAPVPPDYAAAKSSSYWSESLKVRRPHALRQPPQHVNSSLGFHPPNSGLNIENIFAALTELAKNGTQLLDVVTDLAQLSSSSLTKAVGSLHEEVVRLEDVRARLNEGLLFPGKAASSSSPSSGQVSGPALGPGNAGDLVSLQNTTKTIFAIVEAIASNTGWIPYIFHNMQQVERQTNKTLELTKRSLLSVHMSRGLAGGNLADPLQPEDGARGDKASPTRAEALEVIYDTNVQLLRILPALTRLVAEPEPLIALADGGSSMEGRVEVYYKGQWGSVCADSMGHQEAQAVCRHLGHAGGIWAGEEYFGRGSSGRYWQLNMTGCLEAQPPCPFVLASNGTVECLSGHFAVICDHMLRLTPAPELQEDNADTGLLSLHHQGRWLPICSYGWSGYEARVACKQMGYQDGRELDGQVSDWRQIVGNVSGSWVSGVACTGEESRLDSCSVDSFQAKACTDDAAPAAVRCQ